MANQKKFSEIVAVVSTIDADALTAATHTGDYADTSLFQKFGAVFNIGTLGTSATADCSIVQATDSAGTGAKAITNCTATQLTQAGSDDDKQVVINCTADDLDLAGGFTFIAPRIVIGTATSDGSAELYGLYPVNGPASDNDLGSVDEIVN